VTLLISTLIGCSENPRAVGRSGFSRAFLTVMLLVGAKVSAATSGDPENIASADLKTGVVDCSDSLTRKHNPMLVEAQHGVVCFEGYLTKFSNWTEAQDAQQATAWGIPQWTIHRVDARKPGQVALEGRERPRSWFTVRELYEKGLAPADENYRFSQKTRQRQANWYERGHLTQKYLAERVSPTAGRFTHNVVNAFPQRGQFNKGPWLTLECYTGAWANENTAVWIITGPIFLHELLPPG
jgi:DNA/RNA endonuclease G (NUC1)